MQLYSGNLAEPGIAMQVCRLCVLCRMLALMCHVRICGRVLDSLVVSVAVGSQYTACGTPATRTTLHRSCTCWCDGMAMHPNVKFSLHTFTCMLLLRLTSPRHRVSSDYDYML